MTTDDILELMRLKEWSQTRLAAELDLSHAAVQRWLAESRAPRGPARILMRQWLNLARQEHAGRPKRNGKHTKAS